MTIKKYNRRNDSVVEAIQFTGGMENGKEICRWMGPGFSYIPKIKEDPREYMMIQTPIGTKDVKVGTWLIRVDRETALPFKPEAFEAEFVQILDIEHHLVRHARTELDKFTDEDPMFIEALMNTIKGFVSYQGHSGSSAAIAIHMVTALLNGINLLPLTDNPEEWEFHDKSKYGVTKDMWQSTRNNKALSYDEGQTYFLVGEKPSVPGDDITYYFSDKYEPIVEPVVETKAEEKDPDVFGL